MAASTRFTVVKEGWVEAAHCLPLLRNEDGTPHKCARVHGHSYFWRLTIESGSLDDMGMVVDFGAISRWMDRFDHQLLNDLSDFHPSGRELPTTAENFAQVIWDGLLRDILMPINKGTEPRYWLKIVSIELWEGGSGKNRIFMRCEPGGA